MAAPDPLMRVLFWRCRAPLAVRRSPWCFAGAPADERGGGGGKSAILLSRCPPRGHSSGRRCRDPGRPCVGTSRRPVGGGARKGPAAATPGRRPQAALCGRRRPLCAHELKAGTGRLQQRESDSGGAEGRSQPVSGCGAMGTQAHGAARGASAGPPPVSSPTTWRLPHVWERPSLVKGTLQLGGEGSEQRCRSNDASSARGATRDVPRRCHFLAPLLECHT